jgi:hypothetical protein
MASPAIEAHFGSCCHITLTFQPIDDNGFEESKVSVYKVTKTDALH